MISEARLFSFLLLRLLLACFPPLKPPQPSPPAKCFKANPPWPLSSAESLSHHPMRRMKLSQSFITA